MNEEELAELVSLYEAGNLNTAADRCRAALEREADHPEATYMLGRILLAQSDPAAAIPLLRKVVQLAPDWPEAHAALGAALFRSNLLGEAASYMRRAAELEPENVEYAIALERALIGTRQWKEAGRVAARRDNMERMQSVDGSTGPVVLRADRAPKGVVVTPGDLKRWLPARLELHRSDTILLWRYAGAERLNEPFFYQTEERLERQFPDYPVIRTGLDVLAAFADQPEMLQPDGLIFHLGRCGSTVVSNALRAVNGAISVSEPVTLNQLLTPYSEARWPCAPDAWNAVRGRLIRGCVAAYGQRRAGDERRYFIKFTNWNVGSMAFVQSLWPEVPCILMYRDPYETMASNLANPPDWMKGRWLPPEWFRIEPEAAPIMPFEEFVARVLGGICTIAASALGDRARLMHYDDLNAEGFAALLRYFGITEDEVDAVALAEAFRGHGKDVTRTTTFAPDGASKRRSLTDAAREMTALFLAEPYAELERLRSTRDVAR